MDNVFLYIFCLCRAKLRSKLSMIFILSSRYALLDFQIRTSPRRLEAEDLKGVVEEESELFLPRDRRLGKAHIPFDRVGF